ncbi:MAG: hypothetical protein KAX49_11015 [Halanaerobiales bacterium]|nr:hypothetical protein [Halanaerobiales bacterium]
MENREKIREFILEYRDVDDLKDDDDIFRSGIVNSLFAMQLVMFLESTFDISIGNEDLSLNNFCSVNAMLDLINKKQEVNVK